MGMSRQECQRLQRDYIGTEHVLLGILSDEASIAMAVLRRHGVDPAPLRAETEALAGRGPEPVTLGQIPFTAQAKKALEQAVKEAAALGSAHLDTGHLLSGLAGDEAGIARAVLSKHGVTAERLRAARAGLGERAPAELAADGVTFPGIEVVLGLLGVGLIALIYVLAR